MGSKGKGPSLAQAKVLGFLAGDPPTEIIGGSYGSPPRLLYLDRKERGRLVLPRLTMPTLHILRRKRWIEKDESRNRSGSLIDYYRISATGREVIGR